MIYFVFILSFVFSCAGDLLFKSKPRITEYLVKVEPYAPTYLHLRLDNFNNYEIFIKFDLNKGPDPLIVFSKGKIELKGKNHISFYDITSCQIFNALISPESVYFDYPGSYIHNKHLHRLSKPYAKSLVFLNLHQPEIIIALDSIKNFCLGNIYYGGFFDIIFTPSEYIIKANFMVDSLASIVSKGNYTKENNYIVLKEHVNNNTMRFAIRNDTLFCINGSISFPGDYFIPEDKLWYKN